MFRLLVMCLLGLSGVLFETSGSRASPIDTPEVMGMMSMTKEAEGMAAKSKRHNFHVGTPCPLSHSNSGSYLPPAAGLSGHYGAPEHQKPFVIPSYHHIPKVESISYQKPVIPKMIYQTIQRPAIHHAAYNVQPVAKQQVQYIQQPTYVPHVKEQQISYAKPEVSYENVQKLITSYAVKPVQHVQPVQTIHPLKTFAKEIPCEHGPTPARAFVQKLAVKPGIMDMHSYYAKQFFQPISYYTKPMSEPSKPISTFFPHVNKFDYPMTTKVIYQKPKVQISQPHPIVKVASPPEPGCEKLHQPQISYVKTHQPILQTVHQPMFQYAPNYHQQILHHHPPMVHFEQKIHQPAVVHQPLFHFTQKVHQPAVVQQPLVHFSPKIHQPIAHNEVTHYTQPIVYGNSQHSVSTVAPPLDYHGHNYNSPIISVNQPCHK